MAFPQQVALRIVNSTFVADRAEGDGANANGGALYVLNNRPAPFIIKTSTFANNYAGWEEARSAIPVMAKSVTVSLLITPAAIAGTLSNTVRAS